MGTVGSQGAKAAAGLVKTTVGWWVYFLYFIQILLKLVPEFPNDKNLALV